jgi:hypothetical protein
MRSLRTVMNADHTTSPIRPMTWVRGSSSERAWTSSRWVAPQGLSAEEVDAVLLEIRCRLRRVELEVHRV